MDVQPRSSSFTIKTACCAGEVYILIRGVQIGEAIDTTFWTVIHHTCGHGYRHRSYRRSRSGHRTVQRVIVCAIISNDSKVLRQRTSTKRNRIAFSNSIPENNFCGVGCAIYGRDITDRVSRLDSTCRNSLRS